jgi:phosphatidate cytidylyltransferase
MKRVLTALVLVPIVFVLVYLPAQWQPVFVAATAVVAALAAWEYLGLAQRLGADAPRLVVCIAVLALFGATAFWSNSEIFPAILGILSLALLIFCTFHSPIARVLPDAANSVFCLIYCGVTLLALPALRDKYGPSIIVYLFCTVWAGDIAALYVGRAWGRHKLAPSISPNKSWEGAVASVVGSVLVTAGLLWLSDALSTHFNHVVLSFSEDPVWYWLLLAVVLNVAAQVGDLAESALKRSAGVKDSGAILPGHGGVLDRIDALLLAAPTLWYAQLIHHSF